MLFSSSSSLQGFQQKFAFHSKEIIAISCSWCKQAVSAACNCSLKMCPPPYLYFYLFSLSVWSLAGWVTVSFAAAAHLVLFSVFGVLYFWLIWFYLYRQLCNFTCYPFSETGQFIGTVASILQMNNWLKKLLTFSGSFSVHSVFRQEIGIAYPVPKLNTLPVNCFPLLFYPPLIWLLRAFPFSWYDWTASLNCKLLWQSPDLHKQQQNEMVKFWNIRKDCTTWDCQWRITFLNASLCKNQSSREKHFASSSPAVLPIVPVFYLAGVF